MGQGFLIDTNALIDAQMGRMPESGLQFVAEAINHDFTVSFVSYIEFLGFNGVTQDSEDFISLANIIEINKEIINACINIRKTHKIKLPDAIIAATALVFELTIISRNVIDFKGIQGLTVINPHTLA